MKITLDMSKGAYEIAKKLHFGQLNRQNTVALIHEKTGMNPSSASAFVTIFMAMMDGEVYKRAFNNETNKFLFDSIKEDFGKQGLKKALSAAQKHVDYYETLNNGSLKGLQVLINQIKKREEILL